MYKLKTGISGITTIMFNHPYIKANNPNNYTVIDLETATQEQLKFIYEILWNGKDNSQVEKLVEKTATKEK